MNKVHLKERNHVLTDAGAKYRSVEVSMCENTNLVLKNGLVVR